MRAQLAERNGDAFHSKATSNCLPWAASLADSCRILPGKRLMKNIHQIYRHDWKTDDGLGLAMETVGWRLHPHPHLYV